MELLELAKLGMTIHQLAKEDLSRILSRLEMTAAVEAIRKAYIAQDPRAAVYSAIGHLETAEAAILERLKVKDNYEVMGIPFMSNAAAFRPHEVRYNFFSLFYLYAAMATLYYILREKKLAAYTIEKLSEASDRWKKFHSQVTWTLGRYVNPGNWRYLLRELPITPEELDNFAEIIEKWDLSDDDF